VPQLSEPPQPSPTVPQYWPPAAGLQVIFEQLVPPTHMLLLPHPQPLPDAEQSVPQLSELPQPSPTIPQYWPPAAGLQATGVHIPVGPLHKPSWHCHPVFVQVVPQCAVDPHPSPISPQYWSPFAVVQASAVQLASGPALHRWSWQVQLSFVQVVPQ
jgi:hypothetical protein